MSTSESDQSMIERIRQSLITTFPGQLDAANLVPVYDAGNGCLTHLRIPCVHVPEELTLMVEIRNRNDVASTIHTTSCQTVCCDTADTLALALGEMLHDIHFKLESTVLPNTPVASTERWIRYCLERSAPKLFDIEAVTRYPQLSVLNNWKWINLFRYWQIPFCDGTSRHLTIWLNSLMIPGRRGVCITDASGRHERIAQFSTAGELIQCIRELCFVSTHSSSASSIVQQSKRRNVPSSAKKRTRVDPALIKRNPFRRTRNRSNTTSKQQG